MMRPPTRCDPGQRKRRWRASAVRPRDPSAAQLAPAPGGRHALGVRDKPRRTNDAQRLKPSCSAEAAEASTGGRAPCGLDSDPTVRRNLFALDDVSARKHTRRRRKWIKHGLGRWRKTRLSKQARQLLTLPNVSANKRNPRSIRARLWSRTWLTRPRRLAGRLWTGPANLSRAWHRRPGKPPVILYEQGARSGAYVREYAAQEPVVAMLIAGVIGLALGYLLRGATNQSDRAG